MSQRLSNMRVTFYKYTGRWPVSVVLTCDDLQELNLKIDQHWLQPLFQIFSKVVAYESFDCTNYDFTLNVTLATVLSKVSGIPLFQLLNGQIPAWLI